MYVAGRDHPNRDPARRFLESARAGSADLCTSVEVLQEINSNYILSRNSHLLQTKHSMDCGVFIILELHVAIMSLWLVQTL